jgi:hypothetical protein
MRCLSFWFRRIFRPIILSRSGVLATGHRFAMPRSSSGSPVHPPSVSSDSSLFPDVDMFSTPEAATGRRPSRSCSRADGAAPSPSPFSSGPASIEPVEHPIALETGNQYAPKGLLQAFFEFKRGPSGKAFRVACRFPGCTWTSVNPEVKTTSLWRHLFSESHRDCWNSECWSRAVLTHVWNCSRAFVGLDNRCVLLVMRSRPLLFRAPAF